jgi:hypothetical protein
MDHSTLLGFVVLAAVAYFFPFIIAFSRGKDAASVFVLNLFLGWTFIGWVFSLMMAVGTRRYYD